MSTMLAPHFSLEELTQGERAPFTPVELTNLRQLAQLLETVRAAVGSVPLDVTNGLRRPAHNAAAGGVATSQHMDGSAADFIPRGISHLEFHRRLSAAEARGDVPPYGQLIYYPFKLIGASSGHIHLSLPSRGKVGERLVRINEQAPDSAGAKYTTLSSAILAKFPGGAAGAAGTSVVVLLLIVLAGLLLLFPGGLRG